MFQDLIGRFRGRPSPETHRNAAPETSSEFLAPRIFFTPERMDDIENRLVTLGIAKNLKFTVLDSTHSSKVRVDFERGGKQFSAEFDVLKEPDKMTYDLSAKVLDAQGKTVLNRDRRGLHHFEVTQAIITTLPLAFNPEAS